MRLVNLFEKKYSLFKFRLYSLPNYSVISNSLVSDRIRI